MEDNWEALRRECLSCRECALCQTRKNVVFGVGNPQAEIMLVGEGPGANEDEQGIPFVGRAGQFLDDMLAIIGLDRTKVYIANIVKCRPPGNRDPLNVEQDACIGYLRRQIALIQPKIIISLGRIAAMRLINEKFRITREHGVWFDVDGVRMMAIYHPSALLRDPGKRPETFDDLKSLQREIGRVCRRTELNKPWEM
ncbi:MAG: uracil-DNA glycosylase [Oscillibacter sp.]|nr:uracil-DNA glycosylase [Oscillibacter sp.]